MRKINPPLESKQRLTRDNCHEKNKRTTLYFHTWFHARTTIAGKNKLAKQTEQHVITKKSKAREGPDNRPVKRSFRKGNCCFQPDFSTLPRGLGCSPCWNETKQEKREGGLRTNHWKINKKGVSRGCVHLQCTPRWNAHAPARVQQARKSLSIEQRNRVKLRNWVVGRKRGREGVAARRMEIGSPSFLLSRSLPPSRVSFVGHFATVLYISGEKFIAI